MSQWTNRFLSSTKMLELDPITFAMTRFSLNMCLCSQEMPAEVLYSAGIHKQLLDYCGTGIDLVVGPSAMALVHISLHDLMRKEIPIIPDFWKTILNLLCKNDSKPILEQCSKLTASIALYHPNKSPIANSGILHTLFDLILGAHVDVNPAIQYHTLVALLNTIYQSDANRMLALELNGVTPLLTFLRTYSHEESLILAVQTLANIGFCNGYTSNCILLAGGGEILVEILQGSDILRRPEICMATLATFSNACNSDINQAQVNISFHFSNSN